MEMKSIQKQQVQDILNAEDLEGLLVLGAPADEYSGEAERVAAALREWRRGTPTEADIVHVLEGVWADTFGPFSEEEMGKRVPGFGRVARRLLKNFTGAEEQP